LALALFFTLSRGGILAAIAGLAVFVALAPDRAATLRTLLIAGAGAAVLILVADQLPALQAGDRDAAAHREGNAMLAVIGLVCLGVGLAQAAIETREQRLWASEGPPRPSPLTGRAVAVLVAVAGALFLAFGAVTVVWEGGREFKAPAIGLSEAQQRQPTRLKELSARGRYQIWRSALDAVESEPVQGIGPGSFEFWWARDGRLDKYFGSAHSLYFDTLAELGIVGLLLIGSVLVIALLTGAVRAAREPASRHLMAAAVAGGGVFAISAGIEWTWEVGVLPVAFFVLVAIAVGHPGPPNPGAAPRPGPAWRLALAALSVAALVAIVPPLVSTAYVRASEDDVADSRLQSALDDARTAERLQPYAASPKLQQAFVYERLRALRRAARAAREATKAESTNWRTWLVLSRIEARRGRTRAALRAYRKAGSLNPRSRLFRP
jgi:O-antigen ligase